MKYLISGGKHLEESFRFEVFKLLAVGAVDGDEEMSAWRRLSFHRGRGESPKRSGLTRTAPLTPVSGDVSRHELQEAAAGDLR